jgi:hypothetical protein
MNVPIALLLIAIPLVVLIWLGLRAVNEVTQREYDLDWQFQQEDRIKRDLSSFPPFRLQPIENGNLELVLCECEGKREFEKKANAFVKAIRCKIDQKVSGLSEQVWTLSNGEVSLCLSWDDMDKSLSIFSWDPSKKDFVEKMAHRFEQIRK